MTHYLIGSCVLFKSYQQWIIVSPCYQVNSRFICSIIVQTFLYLQVLIKLVFIFSMLPKEQHFHVLNFEFRVKKCFTLVLLLSIVFMFFQLLILYRLKINLDTDCGFRLCYFHPRMLLKCLGGSIFMYRVNSLSFGCRKLQLRLLRALRIILRAIFVAKHLDRSNQSPLDYLLIILDDSLFFQRFSYFIVLFFHFILTFIYVRLSTSHTHYPTQIVPTEALIISSTKHLYLMN